MNSLLKDHTYCTSKKTSSHTLAFSDQDHTYCEVEKPFKKEMVLSDNKLISTCLGNETINENNDMKLSNLTVKIEDKDFFGLHQNQIDSSINEFIWSNVLLNDSSLNFGIIENENYDFSAFETQYFDDIETNSTLDFKEFFEKVSDDYFEIKIAGKMYKLKYAKIVVKKLQLSHLIQGYCKRCDKYTIIPSGTEEQCLECNSKLQLQCLKCGEYFEIWEGMKECMKTTFHQVDEAIACSKCNKIFKRLNNLIKHTKICDTAINFSCKHCTFKTKYKFNLNRHLGIHLLRSSSGSSSEVKNSLKDFFCRYCEKCDKNYKNCLSVKLNHCNQCKTKLEYMCVKCNSKYSTYAQIRYHLLLKCHFQKCVITFDSEENSTAKKNQSIKLFRIQEKLACQFCVYQTKSRVTLNSHIRLHIKNMDVNIK